MNREELFARIQQLDFAKLETQLFLDTHPGCKVALDYFNRTVDELDELKAEYQAKYGPLVADANGADTWDWIDSPWPWHMSGDGGIDCRGGKR